jgi:hypothetical protein
VYKKLLLSEAYLEEICFKEPCFTVDFLKVTNSICMKASRILWNNKNLKEQFTVHLFKTILRENNLLMICIIFSFHISKLPVTFQLFLPYFELSFLQAMPDKKNY